jgi:hypothetical protein
VILVGVNWEDLMRSDRTGPFHIVSSAESSSPIAGSTPTDAEPWWLKRSSAILGFVLAIVAVIGAIVSTTLSFASKAGVDDVSSAMSVVKQDVSKLIDAHAAGEHPTTAAHLLIVDSKLDVIQQEIAAQKEGDRWRDRALEETTKALRVFDRVGPPPTAVERSTGETP